VSGIIILKPALVGSVMLRDELLKNAAASLAMLAAVLAVGGALPRLIGF
jgi:hypothetical protein